MVHAFAYVIFSLLFTSWLGRELGRTYDLRRHWRWIAAAFAIGVLGAAVNAIYQTLLGNFFLHASGGAASAVLFAYLFKTLKLQFNWQLTTMLLFAFVSTLGVLNEIAEYGVELAGVSIFSLDTHDTWRDFIANTIGAAAIWAVLSLTSKRWR